LKGSKEIHGEEENLNWRIEAIRHMILNTDLKSLLGDLGQFVKLPISPYPKIEDCLGLQG